MASDIIEARSVGMKFEDEEILHDVHLRVQAGECLVLIGPSGEGKSVLLKLIAGILAPTAGEILIEGKNLLEISENERLALMRKMGMLFQKNALFDSLTAADNIAFPLREVTDLRETEIQARVDKFLDAVGLAEARDLFPDEISGGMQKRLGIARALALEPQIVLYDDPTAGLDPITSRKIVELIMNLKKSRGSTVVAITNEMARAYQMADHIAMVVDKTVIPTGSVDETKHHKDPRVHQFVSGALSGPLTEIA